MENKSYFRYWGKVEKTEEDKLPRYHLLPYHCLDVAAVGKVLLNPEKPLCQRLAAQLEVDPAWLRNFFCFCLAFHDLGKFSRAFQGLKTDLSPDLIKANSRMPYTERHDTLGFWLWQDNLFSRIENINSDSSMPLNNIKPWLEIVTGHHGIPPKKTVGRIANFFEEEDKEAAFQFVQDVYTLFFSNFEDFSLISKESKKRLKTVSWQLAGIAVLADWQGSNQYYFKYCSKIEGLPVYWTKKALPSAEKAVQAMPGKPKASPFQGITDLFSFIKHPTPLQEYAINEPLGNKPQLFILEDVTGAGKTEAALVLTHRLLSAGLADGLYVALPTMATANAMYHRLGEVYRKFYESSDRPSLVLAHGARELSDAFRQSVFFAESEAEDQNYEKGNSELPEELSATAYCNAWLADSRKKALLGDIGVGTLDQALLSVLPARHQSLRLLGLARKVLLVDEVHAYDGYMQKLLDALLETHARQCGSVILLSATLPQKMRKKLVEAFHKGIDEDAPEVADTAYPLVTHTPVGSKCEKSIDTRHEVKRTVEVERLDKEETIIELIQQAVIKGQSVCWIRNTVKAARESRQDLENCGWLDQDHLHLFHSRFAMVDRQEIEKKTLCRFGEKSKHEERKGHVLIATQVVEQSLDLDFDVLITDLAPIDLIIQRAGRLRRHIRDAQGNRNRDSKAKDQRGTPILHLFSPYPDEEADENWLKPHQPGTQAVYPHVGQLWLTANLLLGEGKGNFIMPDDARILIEGVYSDEAENAIPVKLMEASGNAVGKHLVQQSMANLNVLKLNKGYTRSSGEWDEETRNPTRLTEQETVSVVIASFNQGKLQPYARGGGCHEWALSVVKIPEWEWKKAQDEIPEAMKPLIQNLKKDVNALRWLEIFPLTDETEQYYNARSGWQLETGENL